MKVLLCNRGKFRHPEDEGLPLLEKNNDVWVPVNNLEEARTAVLGYIKNNALEMENFMGGQLVINKVYEGCFTYTGKFFRKDTVYAELRRQWLSAYEKAMYKRYLEQNN